LFDTVNTKINVNISILEVILYAVMVRSIEDEDYRLPNASTPFEVSHAERNIFRRSMSATYAFEDQAVRITDPRSFFKLLRPDHPMDMFFKPSSVSKRES